MAENRPKVEEGDIIEWKGANKVHQGKVITKGDTLLCQMDNGKTFQLNDLRYSKTAKLIKHG